MSDYDKLFKSFEQEIQELREDFEIMDQLCQDGREPWQISLEEFSAALEKRKQNDE